RGGFAVRIRDLDLGLTGVCVGDEVRPAVLAGGGKPAQRIVREVLLRAVRLGDRKQGIAGVVGIGGREAAESGNRNELPGRVVGIGPDVAGAVGNGVDEAGTIVSQRQRLAGFTRDIGVGVSQRGDLAAGVANGDAVAVGVLQMVEPTGGVENLLRAI